MLMLFGHMKGFFVFRIFLISGDARLARLICGLIELLDGPY